MYQNAFYILTLIILPLLPAFLLFKFLERQVGTVTGSGLLGGLNGNLGGAFGAYVLVLLAIYPLVYKAMTPPLDAWQEWNVEGRVNMDGVDPRTIDFPLRPPHPEINNVDGTFSIKLPFPISPRAGTRNPKL